jgi:hypothetical protein
VAPAGDDPAGVVAVTGAVVGPAGVGPAGVGPDGVGPVGVGPDGVGPDEPAAGGTPCSLICLIAQPAGVGEADVIRRLCAPLSDTTTCWGAHSEARTFFAWPLLAVRTQVHGAAPSPPTGGMTAVNRVAPGFSGKVWSTGR